MKEEEKSKISIFEDCKGFATLAEKSHETHTKPGTLIWFTQSFWLQKMQQHDEKLMDQDLSALQRIFI